MVSPEISPNIDAAEVARELKRRGIVAIIRGEFTLAQLHAVAEALLAGGVSVLEVTLNSADALEGIAELRRSLSGRALVGAGTVRTPADVDAAIDAGAEFLISPNFDQASVARSQERGALHLPGVFTASEAEAAFRAGCVLQKLFPANANGPSYLKAIRAPLDDIEFVPTGGIDPDNLASYAAAGAVAFGAGSALVTGPEQPAAELTERAKLFTAALQRARGFASR